VAALTSDHSEVENRMANHVGVLHNEAGAFNSTAAFLPSAGELLGVQKIVPSVTWLRFLEALRISFDWTAAPVCHPARFVIVEPKRHHNASCSRAAACLRPCLGKCACPYASSLMHLLAYEAEATKGETKLKGGHEKA
jgi:hypothetical protein